MKLVMKFITSLGIALVFLLCCCSENKTELVKEVAKEESNTHTYDDLDHFQMGEIHFVNLNLEDSLRKLTHNYQNICAETSLKPLDISTVVLLTSNTKQTHSLKGSFEHILAQLCLIYGAEMEISSPGKYTFYATAQGGEYQTLTMPMLQDISELPALAQIFNSTFYYSKTMTLIVVNGQETDLKRFCQFIQNRTNENSTQVKSSTKLLKIPPQELSAELAKKLDNSKNLTQQQIQQLLDELSFIPDADIMTLPSITSRLDDEATVKLTHELELYLGDEKLPYQPHHWVGYKIDLRPSCIGFNIQTDLQYKNQSIDDFDGMKMEPNTKAMVDSRNQIDSSSASNRSMLSNGHFSIIKISPPRARFNYLLLSQTLIDPSGRPLYR